MRRRLTDIQLWRQDRKSQRLDVGSLMNSVESAAIRRVLFQEDTASIAIVQSHDVLVDELIEPREIIRFIFDDGHVAEYRIEAPQYEYSGAAPPPMKGRHLWHDLDRHIIRRTFETGKEDLSFSIVGRTPAEALAEVMASAPSYFGAGSVSDLSSVQAARKVFVTVQGFSVLAGIKAICEDLECEWDYEYDPPSDKYLIHLVEKVSKAGHREIGHTEYVHEFLNTLELSADRNAELYASRIYPILVSDQGDRNIGEAVWPVSNPGNSTLSLLGAPVLYDDHLVGKYFGNDTDGFFAVVDSDYGNQTITLASSFAGSSGRFAVNADGDWLTYLEPENATYGEVHRTEEVQGAAHHNLCDDAGISATLDSWTAGMPDGYEKYGNPTVEQSTDEKYVGSGSYTARVPANKDEGLQTVEITVPTDGPTAGQYVSAWVAVGVETGAIAVEIVDADGTVHPVGGERETTNSKTLVGIKVQGISEFTSPVRIRVLATRNGTVFHVDALTVVASAAAIEWQDVMGPRGAWQIVGDRIRREGNGAFIAVTGRLIDASYIDSIAFDEIDIGAEVTVRHGHDERTNTFHLDFTTRVVEVQYDLIADIERRVRLERRRADLVDMLTEERNKRRPTPGIPAPPRHPPTVKIARADGADSVQFTLSPVYAGTEDKRLRSYSVYVDHDFNAGTGLWIKRGDGSFAVWESEDDVFPHVLTVLRPEREAGERTIRLYVRDDETGLRTEILLLSVSHAPLRVWSEPRQTVYGAAFMDIYVVDPMRVVTSMEVARKSAQDSSFGAWAAEPVAPGTDEEGTFGTDGFLKRIYAFPLDGKHDTHVKARVGWTAPSGSTQYVHIADTYDRDVRAEVEAIFLQTIAGGDVELRAHGDDDAKAQAWAVSEVDFDSIDDAAFDAAIVAGDFVNSRDLTTIVYNALDAGATLYVKVRPFRKIDPANGTDGNGVDREIKITGGSDLPMPVVSVAEIYQEGSVGFMKLRVTDSYGIISQVQFRKAVGRNLKSDDVWDTVAVNQDGDFVYSVDLVEGHDSFIQPRALLDLGFEPITLEAQAFDKDTVPNPAFSYDLVYDNATDKYKVVLYWTGNEDTKSVYHEFAVDGGVPTTGTVDQRSGSVDLSSGFTVDPETPFTILARGYSEIAGSGTPSATDFSVSETTPGTTVPADAITGVIGAQQLLLAAKKFSSTITWSATGQFTAAWSTGVLEVLGGPSYSITGANTGTMLAGEVYAIYLDPDVSTTTFQVSSDISDAIGENKLLVCMAWPSTLSGDGASYTPAIGAAANAPSISADMMSTNVLTAVKANITQLTALATFTGFLQVDDELVLDTGGVFRSGATTFSDGTGIWMDYNGGSPRFRVGNPSGNYFSFSTATGDLIVQGIKSSNYVAGSSGYYIDEAGNAEFEEIIARSSTGQGFASAIGGGTFSVRSNTVSTSWHQLSLTHNGLFLTSHNTTGLSFAGGTIQRTGSNTGTFWNDDNVIEGDGISIFTRTISHEDTSSEPDFVPATNSLTFAGAITLDDFGHVTDIDGKTITLGTGLAKDSLSTQIFLSHLGLENLSDPGVDRILFWDETANALKWLTVGSNLTITGTTIDASGGGGGDITAVTAGTGLSGGGTTGDVSLLHADTSSEPDFTTTTNSLTFVGSIALDDFGHVTDIDGKTITLGAGLVKDSFSTEISFSHLGLQSLSDPGADRIFFWDESANAAKWLTAGSGLTLSGTDLSHADTSSEPDFVTTSNSLTFASGVTLDTYGHVTDVTGKTITLGTGLVKDSFSTQISIDTSLVPRKSEQETITNIWTFSNNILLTGNYAELENVGSLPASPPTNRIRLYVVGEELYFIDSGGVRNKFDYTAV